MSREPEVEILYEEGPCVVVRKPFGLLTQAVREVASLERNLKSYIRRRENSPGDIYLVPIHRLDRPVSGVVLFARNVRAAKKLAHQFEKRQVRKVYWACVSGQVDEPSGTWTDHVRKVPGEARAEVVSEDHPQGRIAMLHYRTLATGRFGTWLEITLETGRTHQIRIQAAARGLPVLGDQQYGSPVAFGPQTEDLRERAIALHGRSLRFKHPKTQQHVRVTARCDDCWMKLGLPAREDLAESCVETWPDGEEMGTSRGAK